MNLQRTAIYEERNAILDGKDLSSRIETIFVDAITDLIESCCPERSASDDWDLRAINAWVRNMTGLEDFDASSIDHDDSADALGDAILDYLLGVYRSKEAALGEDALKKLGSQVMLNIIDVRWMAHLQEMDYLRTGIGLRALGQRDPLTEYKDEAHSAFAALTAGMYEDFMRTILRLQIAAPEEAQAVEAPETDVLEGRNVSYTSPEQTLSESSISRDAVRQAASGRPPAPASQKAKTYRKADEDPYANVGRNDPCPCGSGKKFKKCHGANR